MIIKRWNGAWVKEFPQTKAQLIRNNADSAFIFDSNDKLLPTYLPDSVFDTLTYYGTTTGDVASAGSRLLLANALEDMRVAAAAANRSVKGYYFVITATGTITGLTGIAAYPAGVNQFYTLQFRPQDGGTSGTANTSSGVLEAGDWFVIENISGDGGSGTPYVITASVVNNSFELATTTIDGIVRLSDATVYSTLSGNHAITEGVLKTVIDNASFAASSHAHGNISTGGEITATTVAPANTDVILISDTSNSGKIERGITIGTSTTTFLTEAGTWATPTGNYSLPAATSTVRGGIELFSDTAQTVAANAVTATASRTYGIQVNGDGQAVVNVPWTDTNTTYSEATSSTYGLVKIGYTALGQNYPVELALGKMYVNVPWTDTVYTLPAATSTLRGGIELGSDTQQSVAANAVTATASRTYALQVNSAAQGVVNVPWTDTTYSAGEGITLSSTTFRMTYPLYVQTATPTTSVTGTIWYDIN